MVRTGGGAAKGSLAKGGKFAGAGNFPEAPLKRLHPWSLDNKNLTDIIAGTMDASGQFKGVLIQDAHVMALFKYLKLSQTSIPDTLPAEVKGIGQSVKEGYPTIIVTRGSYGRELDPKRGPMRNKAQERVWDLVREARMENPRMLITLVDAPVNATSIELAKALQEPLKQYRELAYYDGIWYAPECLNAEGYTAWQKDLAKKPLIHASVAHWHIQKSSNPIQNQQEFGWRKLEEKPNWMLIWKQVHKEEAFVPEEVPEERLRVDTTETPDAIAAAPIADKEVEDVDVATVLALVEREFERMELSMETVSPVKLLKPVDQYLAKEARIGKAGCKDAAVQAAKKAAELYGKNDDKPHQEEALAVAEAVAAGGTGVDREAQAAAEEAFAKAKAMDPKEVSAPDAAREAVAKFKEANVTGLKLAEALTCEAEIALANNKNYTAMWSAKQALVQASLVKDESAQRGALALIEKIGTAGGQRPPMMGAAVAVPVKGAGVPPIV